MEYWRLEQEIKYGKNLNRFEQGLKAGARWCGCGKDRNGKAASRHLDYLVDLIGK